MTFNPTLPETLSLHMAPLGTPVRIDTIADMDIAAQVIRMGIGPGSHVIATTRLPHGPTILRCGAVELALGCEISQHIHVSLI